jgi:hypothetical protein
VNVTVRKKPQAKRYLVIHRGFTLADANELAHIYRLLGYADDCISIAEDDQQRLKAAG